ncbi:hypothetical protein FHP29_09765 [Nocardioides albidus]|uniref:Protein kinase domain-containing protein n=1 Tax=Nocardioides albidus TaxID=1517589 RepID=A0A5C4W1P2_9ACTN|nr:hypothetical protein [Nocardioides albidus]TNM41269.1 hypothetical protein FHP29_09765 [Nocardioides albidus]
MSGYGVLSPDDAARLLLPVAESLAASHASGSRHGAVSPAAVEVAHAGRAILLDRTRVSPDPVFTAPGAADDAWSLAGVLLHAVTGEPPAPHSGPVVPRSAGWLAPIIELGLRPDPRDRPSVAEIADYLRARVAPAPERRRPSTSLLVLAGAAVITVLGVVGAGLLFAGGDGERPRSSPRTSEAASTEPAEEPPTAVPSDGPAPPTAAQLERFARDYVATASGDPAVGFTWLTPAYQQRSPRYREVWASIREPRILSVTPHPATMRVDYTYRYRLAGVGTRTEDITLFLVQSGRRLLIADATAR